MWSFVLYETFCNKIYDINFIGLAWEKEKERHIEHFYKEIYDKYLVSHSLSWRKHSLNVYFMNA